MFSCYVDSYRDIDSYVADVAGALVALCKCPQ